MFQALNLPTLTRSSQLRILPPPSSLEAARICQPSRLPSRAPRLDFELSSSQHLPNGHSSLVQERTRRDGGQGGAAEQALLGAGEIVGWSAVQGVGAQDAPFGARAEGRGTSG